MLKNRSECGQMYYNISEDRRFLIAINFGKSPHKGKDNLQIAMLRASVASNSKW